MALIEIRNPQGTRLAAADDLSGAIAQLVALCDRQASIIRDQHDRINQWSRAKPDVSATAPEHVAVFSAGWKAAQIAAPVFLD